MRYFLGHNNTIANATPLDESLLRRVNVVREVGFEYVGEGFGNKFID